MASIYPPVLLVLLFTVSNVTTQRSLARLEGAVTMSVDPEIITVTITNIGSATVSVLCDNNLFDVYGLSMPFTVSEEESGHRVPIAWTHSKATIDEYLNLKPGETFQRNFNLTDYMPVDMVLPVNVSIALPKTLPVVGVHPGPVNVGHRTDTWSLERKPILVSPSYLHQALESEPLNLTWTPWANEPAIKKRQAQGFSIVQGTCKGKFFPMVTAIQDAVFLAGAGLNASASFGDIPYSYFFSSDITTADIVAGIYQRVIDTKQGILGDVQCTCEDLGNFCDTDDTHGPNSFRPGYSANIPATSSPNQLPLIVICPKTFSVLKHIPVPCCDTRDTPGAQSLGGVMLHELVHINSINGGLPITDLFGVSNAWDVNDAMGRGENTTLDASAYAHMASFAWDLGLGGPPWTGETCLQNWTRGNFYGHF